MSEALLWSKEESAAMAKRFQDHIEACRALGEAMLEASRQMKLFAEIIDRGIEQMSK